MKLYLGCGPGPLHNQHKGVMGDPSEWTFVDYYVREPHIKNWDAATLEEVGDTTVEKIYTSHLLEHFSHIELDRILGVWYSKLVDGGEIIINVPDLEWACRQCIKYAQGQILDGYFYEFEGEHGLLSIFYGSHSHNGEYHKSGFIKSSLEDLLLRNRFKNIAIEKMVEGHDMGCLLARATK